MKFKRTRQGSLFASAELSLLDKSATVEWQAYAHGAWHTGNAGTVWDACQAIELL